MKTKEVIKSESCRACKPTSCEQIDNVYRDGYVSIKEQFAEFQRAGINRMQWLAKAYPADKTEAHEKALFESRDELIAADSFNRGDSLNVLDGSKLASEMLSTKQLEVSRQLAEEHKLKQDALIQEQNKYKDFYENYKDKVDNFINKDK